MVPGIGYLQYDILATYFNWQRRGVTLSENTPGKLTASGIMPEEVDELRRHKLHYLALLGAEREV
jgi:hypothetical protein